MRIHSSISPKLAMKRRLLNLMRAYHAYVCAIVVGIVKNSHDAEEVVQDTFLSAYRGLAQLEDSAKFKSWLAEIARNRARNWLRKQRGRDYISRRSG